MPLQGNRGQSNKQIDAGNDPENCDISVKAHQQTQMMQVVPRISSVVIKESRYSHQITKLMLEVILRIVVYL